MYLRSRAAAREGGLQIQRIRGITTPEEHQIEGFSNDDTNKDTSTGTDSKTKLAASKKILADIKASLSRINAPYAAVRYAFDKTGNAIASTLSRNQAKKDEANIITDQLYAISSIAMAIWVAYNWFFIFVYKPHELIGPDIMRITPMDLGHFVPTTLFRYTVVPLYVLQAGVHDYIGPVFSWIARVLGNKIALMIIFAIAIGMVHTNGDFVVREFFSALQCKFSSMMALWAFMMIGYSLYITFHVPVNIPIVGPYINTVVDLMNMYYLMSSPFSMIFSTIRFFIRLGFAMMIGFVASALVFGYILFISLFSILAYKDTRISISDTIKTLLDFVSGDIPPNRCGLSITEKIKYFASLEYYFSDDNTNKGERETIRYKVAVVLFTISEYVYEVIFQLAFASAFSNSAAIFARKIHTSGLKQVLILITALLSSTLWLSIMVRLYTKYTNNPPVLNKPEPIETHAENSIETPALIETHAENSIEIRTGTHTGTPPGGLSRTPPGAFLGPLRGGPIEKSVKSRLDMATEYITNLSSTDPKNNNSMLTNSNYVMKTASQLKNHTI
jgi:hypothetical protein